MLKYLIGIIADEMLMLILMKNTLLFRTSFCDIFHNFHSHRNGFILTYFIFLPLAFNAKIYFRTIV
jgi:hypothetical protein